MGNDVLDTCEKYFLPYLQCNTVFQANEHNRFSFPQKWIFPHTKPLSEMKEYFRKLDILVDSDVNLLEININGTATLRKIYRLHYDLLVEPIGYWNKDDGFKNIEIEQITTRRRNNLKGLILNTCIVITNNDTLNHLTDKR